MMGITEILLTLTKLENYNKILDNIQSVGEKVHARMGNSPDYKLRS